MRELEKATAFFHLESLHESRIFHNMHSSARATLDDGFLFLFGRFPRKEAGKVGRNWRSSVEAQLIVNNVPTTLFFQSKKSEIETTRKANFVFFS